MTRKIDINCDLGEGLNNEAGILPYISSCSIACGGHAGSKRTVRKVIDLALENNVKVGAHPSFPDRANFGRIRLEMPFNQLQESLEAQIQMVQEVCKEQNCQLNHIKPHGALYNLAAKDRSHAELIVKTIKKCAPDSALYAPYNSIINDIAIESGLSTKIEAFADRNYNADLSLVSRNLKKAVITDKEEVLQHLLKMILENKVITLDGVEVKMAAETYCFHGDNPKVLDLLKYCSEELQKNKIIIA